MERGREVPFSPLLIPGIACMTILRLWLLDNLYFVVKEWNARLAASFLPRPHRGGPYGLMRGAMRRVQSKLDKMELLLQYR
jgi:hypothetical protein